MLPSKRDYGEPPWSPCSARPSAGRPRWQGRLPPTGQPFSSISRTREQPSDWRHPAAALGPLEGLVVIDEVQRQPELFALLRVLADRDPLPARFLILGSASPDLVRGVSESLAGRVSFVDVAGFDLAEVGPESFEQLWLRGGFPRSFLAEADDLSMHWRNDFVRTFLERDVPQLGITIPAATLRRFWTMIAHFHGQVWNAAELARSLGSAEGTARRYLDILTSVFLVRQLPPWFENIGKRQVKSPKVYVRDSGLLHALLGLDTKATLESHPKLGGVLGGVRARAGPAAHRRARCLLLGNACRSRARSPSPGAGQALRRRVEVRRCAQDHPVDARRDRRPGARLLVRRPSGRGLVSNDTGIEAVSILDVRERLTKQLRLPS